MLCRVFGCFCVCFSVCVFAHVVVFEFVWSRGVVCCVCAHLYVNVLMWYVCLFVVVNVPGEVFFLCGTRFLSEVFFFVFAPIYGWMIGCLFVYVFVCRFVFLYVLLVCFYVCVWVGLFVHVCVFISQMHLRKCVCVYVNFYVWVCVLVYVFLCVCV